MKITSEKESGFRPITISIVLESVEELEAFYQIGSYKTYITDDLDRHGWNEEVLNSAAKIIGSFYELGKKYKENK